LEPSLYLQLFTRYRTPKHIWVTTLTFHGHVTSSVTWQFDSKVAISYRCFTGTKSVSVAVVEIMSCKYIGVMTLTYLGHVTSSATWPFESQWAISYRRSSRYLPPFSRYCSLSIWGSRLNWLQANCPERFPHKGPVASKFAGFKPSGISRVGCNVGGLPQA